MNESNSTLTLTPQIISKVMAKFNNELKIAIEEDKLYLIHPIKIPLLPDLNVKVEVEIEKIENNTILLKLIPPGILKSSLMDKLISYLYEKIEELLNIYLGSIKFNYPDLLIDLNTITLKNGMKLTELVEIKDIIINNNIEILLA